jgi:hypothetical protein
MESRRISWYQARVVRRVNPIWISVVRVRTETKRLSIGNLFSTLTVYIFRYDDLCEALKFVQGGAQCTRGEYICGNLHIASTRDRSKWYPSIHPSIHYIQNPNTNLSTRKEKRWHLSHGLCIRTVHIFPPVLMLSRPRLLLYWVELTHPEPRRS